MIQIRKVGKSNGVMISRHVDLFMPTVPYSRKANEGPILKR